MKGFWIPLLVLALATSAGAQPSAPGAATAPAVPATSAGPPSGSAPAASAAPATAPSGTAAPLPSVVPGVTPAPAGASAQAVDGSTYAVRLRDLESRVDELKEQIRRSHTRLSLLSDTILAGGVGGARAEITLVNELSGAVKVVRALVVLDGAVQYNKVDEDGALGGQTEIPIFSGSIPAGDHTVQVLIKLKGHGYGVFSYLKGYQFELKDSHAFTIADGKTVQIRVIAWEKGGVTTPLEQRPAIRYVEKIRSGNDSRSRSGEPESGED